MPRKVPPSQRGERVPDQVVRAIHSVGPRGMTESKIRESAQKLVRLGYIAYRQDARGVYHVRCRDNPGEFLAPPPGFPQGHCSREQLLIYIHAQKMDIRPDVISGLEDSPEGNDRLHILMALDLMAGDRDIATPTDLEIVRFLGWKDEEFKGPPSA